MESKRSSVLLIVSVFILGIALGNIFSLKNINLYVDSNQHKEKLNRLIDLIENNYVDRVNTDSIVNNAVNTILGQLDPHSVYIPKDETESMAEFTRGNFVGIGITFYMYRDSLTVLNTLKGGPSEKAGLKPGDRILKVNGEIIYGQHLTNDSLVSKIKGAEDSEITTTIFRKEQKKVFSVTMKRAVVPIKSVDIGLMLPNGVGYIKVNRFAETTYTEFRDALLRLKNLGMTSLIVDVRDNGGGYMDQVTKMANELLDNQSLIVFTKDKNDAVTKTFATKEGLFKKGKVFILINENTASASEILAGAIQDNDRGLIVGRRSFGKGLVQRDMPLGDGSSVRLTVSRYYTPTGRSIQKSYKLKGESYNDDFIRRFESGELYSADNIKIADTLKFKTPKGKIVYGGGGIVPDLFVPLESSQGDEGVFYVLKSGIVDYFVFELLDKDRAKFERLSFDDFKAMLQKEDFYYHAFKTYLKQHTINLPLDKEKKLVTNYLLAAFAKQVYNDTLYFEVLLQEDPMVNKVLAVIAQEEKTETNIRNN